VLINVLLETFLMDGQTIIPLSYTEKQTAN